MVDQLRRGTLVGRGGFLLDKDQAIQKLQEFQLPTPYHYALEFVKASAILGADRITFDLGVTHVEGTFDGVAVSPGPLLDIYSAPFTSHETREERALRHLAIGITAARRLGLRELTLEVHRHGESPHGISLRGDEVEEIVPEPLSEAAASRITTRIRMRKTIRPQRLLRFSRYFYGEEFREEELLREKCRFSSQSVVVQGESISIGIFPPRRAVETVPFRYEDETGVVSVLSEEVRDITVLHHGVVLSRTTDPRPDGLGVWAMVDSPRLTVNLTQSAFVEDHAWEALHRRILRHGLLGFVEYVRPWMEWTHREEPGEELSTRRRLLMQQNETGLVRNDLSRYFLDLMAALMPHQEEFDEATVEALKALADLKVFERADGRAGDWEAISINDACHMGSLWFSTDRLRNPEAPKRRPVLLLGNSETRQLREYVEEFLSLFASHLTQVEEERSSVDRSSVVPTKPFQRGSLKVDQFHLRHFGPRRKWAVGIGVVPGRNRGIYYRRGNEEVARVEIDRTSPPLFVEIGSPGLTAADVDNNPAVDEARRHAYDLLVARNFFVQGDSTASREAVQRAFGWDGEPARPEGSPEPLAPSESLEHSEPPEQPLLRRLFELGSPELTVILTEIQVAERPTLEGAAARLSLRSQGYLLEVAEDHLAVGPALQNPADPGAELLATLAIYSAIVEGREKINQEECTPWEKRVLIRDLT